MTVAYVLLVLVAIAVLAATARTWAPPERPAGAVSARPAPAAGPTRRPGLRLVGPPPTAPPVPYRPRHRLGDDRIRGCRTAAQLIHREDSHRATARQLAEAAHLELLVHGEVTIARPASDYGSLAISRAGAL